LTVERILKGELFAAEIKDRIRGEIGVFQKKYKMTPALCVIQLTKDPCFSVYQSAQKKCAESLGITVTCEDLSSFPLDRQKKKIRALSRNRKVQGMIVQMPIPDKTVQREILSCVAPEKDIEGVTPYNQGLLFSGQEQFVSPTALAGFRMVQSLALPLKGKEVVIVGHSALVGKPLAMLFLKELATVTLCHIGTYERETLSEHIQRAEILCVAVGKAHLIQGEWIKKGAVVIDIGINKSAQGITGDVDFLKAQERAAYITPVPGGVGPFTTAIVFENLMKAVRLQHGGSR